MSLSDDAKEFFSQISNSPEITDPSLRGSRHESDSNDDGRGPLVGRLTQYAKIGAGFGPIPATIKKLPPGCYRISFNNDAPYFDPMTIVTDKILRLPDSKSEYIVSEIQKFWDLKEEFKKYGFLYKTGFMMYGPPGSGKTMTIQIVIEEMLQRGGVILHIEQPAVGALMLQRFREIEPNRPVVVILEDIDALITRWGESDLLSLLDGENQIDNVTFLATTNYPERLDPRIVNRPSRFDYVVKVPMPNLEARKLYFTTKLGTHLIERKDGSFLDAAEATEGLSIAHLREVIRSIFIMKHDPDETIIRLSRMKILPKSTGDNPLGIGSNLK